MGVIAIMNDINEKPTLNKTTFHIMISSFIFLSVSILELYWMINRSYEYIILIVLGLIIIISGLSIIKGIKNRIDKYYKIINNHYEEIIRTDKAVYILVKRSFTDINEEMERIKGISEPITSEIVEKQKSIAKLTISKNRKSIEEVLNSNLKVLEELEKVSKYVELSEVNIGTQKSRSGKSDKPEPKLYDDPNTNLTPEEIAALFESMGD